MERIRVGVLLAAMLAGCRVAPVAGQGVEVGLKAGWNATTVVWTESRLGDTFDELRRRNAISGGVFAVFPLTRAFRLRVEALYSAKGFEEVQPDGDRMSLDVDYFEVPALLGFALGSGSGPVTPEVYAGPWMAWEWSCDASAEIGGTSVALGCDEIPDDEVLRRTTDWGVAIGVALTFDTPGPLRGLVDARYSAGLRNVDSAPDLDNLDVHHRGVGVSIGLSLPLS